MELSTTKRQSLNSSTKSYFKLPSENSQVQDLYFQLNKQILEMINSTELTDDSKVKPLKNIKETVQNEFSNSSYISRNLQYNNVRMLDYSRLQYNEGVSMQDAKVIPLLSNFKYINSLVAYNADKRGDIAMNINEEEIKNLTDSYSKNLLPSISFGMGIGIITTAFKIAMDYMLVPLMIFAIVDIFLSGYADLITKEKEGKIFKKISQYFIIFFILTWLIIFELILLRYNLTPMLEPVIENHLLVYGFLAGAAIMCLTNIRYSMVRLELPVGPFTKIFRLSLEKYGPELTEFIDKYSKETKGKDNDSNKK